MARASGKVSDRRWPNSVKSKVCLRKYKRMIHSSGSIGEKKKTKGDIDSLEASTGRKNIGQWRHERVYFFTSPEMQVRKR